MENAYDVKILDTVWKARGGGGEEVRISCQEPLHALLSTHDQIKPAVDYEIEGGECDVDDDREDQDVGFAVASHRLHDHDGQLQNVPHQSQQSPRRWWKRNCGFHLAGGNERLRRRSRMVCRTV